MTADETGAPASRGGSTSGAQTPIIAVVLAGFLLRLWRLGGESLWTDEGSTWTAASSSVRRLIELCATRDASPPLFYLLASIGYRLGHDEAGLRLVSALASTGLIILTYRLARLAAGRRTSTIAAAFTALSPYQLMYAQEARTYTTVAFFTVLSLYLFARAALLGRPRAWLPYVVATTLGLYTQAIALLGVAVQGFMVVFSRAGRLRILTWGLALAVALLVHVPWLIVSLTQASHLGSSHWYIRPPDPHNILQVLRAVFLAPITLVSAPETSTMPGLDRWMPSWLGQALLILAPGIPLLASLRRMDDPGDRGRIARFCLIALGLPLAAVFAASFRTPLWLPRYFVLLTPMLSVLMALGVASLRPRALAVGWTALVLLIGAYADFRYYIDYTKERWRDVVARVAAVSAPESTAVIVTFDPDPFEFYNQRLPHRYRVVPFAHPDVPFHDAWTDAQLAEMDRAVRDATRDAADVWVVIRSPNSPPRKLVARMADSVAASGRELALRDSLDSYQGKLRIRRWRSVDRGVIAPPRPPTGRRGVGATVPGAAYDTLRPAPRR